MTNKKFYVYFLIGEQNILPFYVGKGNTYRKNSHINEAIKQSDICGNKRTIKNNKILKLLNNGIKIHSIIIKDNLTEEQAFKLEKHYIKYFGRIDIGTGRLTNMSDGGEGNSGCKWSEHSKNKIKNRVPWNKGIPCTEETKLKISKSNKGKKRTKEQIENIKKSRKPLVFTKEIRKKISDFHKGKKKSKESIEKRLKTMKGFKQSEKTKKLMSEQRKGKKRYANPFKLKIIYINPEELNYLDDKENWFNWAPSVGFCDNVLREKYPKQLFYRDSNKS